MAKADKKALEKAYLLGAANAGNPEAGCLSDNIEKLGFKSGVKVDMPQDQILKVVEGLQREVRVMAENQSGPVLRA